MAIRRRVSALIEMKYRRIASIPQALQETPMDLNEVTYCRSVPDDDPLFSGVPDGSSLVVDGILYVRHGDWLPFLEAVSAASAGGNGASGQRTDSHG